MTLGFDKRIADAMETATGPFNFAVMAAELVEEASRSELDAWLRANARVFVADVLQDRARSERARARAHHSASVFSEAAERFVKDGDEEAFVSPFHVSYAVNDNNDRVRVADMTAEHLRYVAGTYRRTGNRALMLAKFHEAVAKKVGRKTVADVMTEEQYEALRNSICGGEAAA